MSATDAAARPEEARVSTGNPSIDEILMGGLVGRRPYLIVGPAGTGKTTLSLQFLCEGVRRGERCLIVTLEEPPNEMLVNHRGLRPDLDKVFVFDAIPDVMRYERTPFKDIAAVRESITFDKVAPKIRKTPELSSVEVTFTALEQTLKMEIARRKYTRIVIDSLTALQYFCMKGVDETVGAQTFLRFLSDLRITTLLTVEAPIEDVETPERLLARGEIRLFRWELDGKTVRAIGVEKFRGSPHDIRLHPYRIGSHGLGVNLDVTISRDTRQVVETPAISLVAPVEAATVPPVTVDPLDGFDQELRDLVAVGADLRPVNVLLSQAEVALRTERLDETSRSIETARRAALDLARTIVQGWATLSAGATPEAQAAAHRLGGLTADLQAGLPPHGPFDRESMRPRLEGWLRAIQTSRRTLGTAPITVGTPVASPPPPPGSPAGGEVPVTPVAPPAPIRSAPVAPAPPPKVSPVIPAPPPPARRAVAPVPAPPPAILQSPPPSLAPPGTVDPVHAGLPASGRVIPMKAEQPPLPVARPGLSPRDSPSAAVVPSLPPRAPGRPSTARTGAAPSAEIPEVPRPTLPPSGEPTAPSIASPAASLAAPPEEPAVAAPAPRKKKGGAAVSRRKATARPQTMTTPADATAPVPAQPPQPPTPALAPPAMPVAEVSPGAPPAVEPSAPPVAPPVGEPSKSKRRAPRKRKPPADTTAGTAVSPLADRAPATDPPPAAASPADSPPAHPEGGAASAKGPSNP